MYYSNRDPGISQDEHRVYDAILFALGGRNMGGKMSVKIEAGNMAFKSVFGVKKFCTTFFSNPYNAKMLVRDVGVEFLGSVFLNRELADEFSYLVSAYEALLDMKKDGRKAYKNGKRERGDKIGKRFCKNEKLVRKFVKHLKEAAGIKGGYSMDDIFAHLRGSISGFYDSYYDGDTTYDNPFGIYDNESTIPPELLMKYGRNPYIRKQPQYAYHPERKQPMYFEPQGYYQAPPMQYAWNPYERFVPDSDFNDGDFSPYEQTEEQFAEEPYRGYIPPDTSRVDAGSYQAASSLNHYLAKQRQQAAAKIAVPEEEPNETDDADEIQPDYPQPEDFGVSEGIQGDPSYPIKQYLDSIGVNDLNDEEDYEEIVSSREAAMKEKVRSVVSTEDKVITDVKI